MLTTRALPLSQAAHQHPDKKAITSKEVEESSTAAMDEASPTERALTSFASLLSSALTIDGDLPEPLAGSSSALPCFFSRSVGPSEAVAALPGLDLRAGKSASLSASSAVAAGAGAGLEDSAALHLAAPFVCSRDDLAGVPKKILANVASSFVQLIDARMRSSLSALLRKTLQRGAMAGFGGSSSAGGVGSDAHTKMVIGLLSSETPVAPTTVVTSFRVLPGAGGNAGAPGADSVVLPLVYEAVIDLSVLGTAITVAIRAPGTIAATFDDADNGGDGLIRSVEVTLDTLALLRAMMKQARFAVKKAVSAASAIAATLVTAAGTGSATGKTGGGSLNLLGQNLGAGTHRRNERRSSPLSSAGARTSSQPRMLPVDKMEPSGEHNIVLSTGEQSGSFSSLSRKSSSSCSSCQSDPAQDGTCAKESVPITKEQNFDMPPPPPRKPLRGCYSSPGLQSGLSSALSHQPRYQSAYRPVMPLGPLRPTPETASAVSKRSPSQELRNVRFKDLTVSDDRGNKNAVWGPASPGTSSQGGEASSGASPSNVRCLDSAAAAQGLAMLATSTSSKLGGIKKRARHSEAGASLAAAAAAAATAALDEDEDQGTSAGPLRKRRVMSCPSMV
mmetsp:Transcript_59480/g.176487  ORF Transcript_59480/g.176487 Transcript_59480/m.176487 type:complete len:618 (-) Transcript_59480:143-1996(-)